MCRCRATAGPRAQKLAGTAPPGERPFGGTLTTGRAHKSIPGWLVTPDVPPQYLAPMGEDDCLRYGWQIIRDRVEHHLQDVAPSLALTSNGEDAVKYALRYSTLLEAAYLHLRRMIGGADRIGRCRECGQLYLQGREDKEFCSAQHANTYWRRQRRRK